MRHVMQKTGLKIFVVDLIYTIFRDRSEFMTWGLEVLTRTAGQKLVPLNFQSENERSEDSYTSGLAKKLVSIQYAG